LTYNQLHSFAHPHLSLTPGAHPTRATWQGSTTYSMTKCAKASCYNESTAMVELPNRQPSGTRHWSRTCPEALVSAFLLAWNPGSCLSFSSSQRPNHACRVTLTTAVIPDKACLFIKAKETPSASPVRMTAVASTDCWPNDRHHLL
jgi:hypothetical protein